MRLHVVLNPVIFIRLNLFSFFIGFYLNLRSAVNVQ